MDARLVRIGIVLVLIIGILLIISALRDANEAAPTDVYVDVTDAVKTVTRTEEIALPNCDGTSELEQVLKAEAQVSRSVDIGTKATTGLGEEVAIPEVVKAKLEAKVEQAYQNVYKAASSRLDSITMKAAANTHVIYDIEWEEQVSYSTVSYKIGDETYTAHYTYTLRVPRIGGSRKVSCPTIPTAGRTPEQAQVTSTPPSTPAPTAADTPTEIATPVSRPTPTVRPTTPMPTIPDTATSLPAEQPRDLLTPIPATASDIDPNVQCVTDPCRSAPILDKYPENGAKFVVGSQIELKWTWDDCLPPGWHFAIRISDYCPPDSCHYESSPPLISCQDGKTIGRYFIHKDSHFARTPGTYYWNIAVARSVDGGWERLSYDSEIRTFIVIDPEDDDGGGGGGEDETPIPCPPKCSS